MHDPRFPNLSPEPIPRRSVVPGWANVVGFGMFLATFGLLCGMYVLLVAGLSRLPSLAGVGLIAGAIVAFVACIATLHYGGRLLDPNFWIAYRLERGKCPYCRYELLFSSSESCPECGMRVGS